MHLKTLLLSTIIELLESIIMNAKNRCRIHCECEHFLKANLVTWIDLRSTQVRFEKVFTLV